MKRILKVFAMVSFMALPALVHAGGIMTNTNQSASYIRLLVLDAVIGPEGAYYNPAGLSFLQDGFHLSVSNQSILQKRTIQTTFPMNRGEFEGTVSAPLFPSVYAVYKTGSLAFSLGVNPIGGGGSALFEEGLPSFEQQVAVLPAGLQAAGINTTQYGLSTRFDAQSLFWGVQATASYALNDMLSAAVGFRYVTARNTYDGYLNDIMINPDLRGHPQLGALGAIYSGSMTSAPAFFGTLAGVLQEQVNILSGVAGSLQPFISGGLGSATLSQALQGGYLTEAQVMQISGGILQLNPQLDPSAMTLQQIQGFYAGAAQGFDDQRQEMEALQAMTSNREVSVTQTGSSFTPIFGVNLRLSDRVNLAVKYEHKTPLTVVNETETDGTGLYPDGVETAQNLPAMLSVGGQFGLTDKLTLHTGVHYYFDKSADYGKARPNDEIIDKNFWEAGLGLEYRISPMFLVSAGYLRTQTGINDLYHSDISHSLSTNTFGGGLRMQLNDMIALNLGGLYSHYIQHTKAYSMPGGISWSETYDRSNMVFAVGVDLKI
jgi:long-subunit fatty acid transport protein